MAPRIRRRAVRALARTVTTAAAVAAAALALAGCARKGADQFVVGFSQMESNNPWRIAETKSLRDEAREARRAARRHRRAGADGEAGLRRRGPHRAPRESSSSSRRASSRGSPPRSRPRRPRTSRSSSSTARRRARPGTDYVTLLALELRRAGAARRGVARAADRTARPASSSSPARRAPRSPPTARKGFRDGLAKYPGMTDPRLADRQLLPRAGRARDAEPRAVVRPQDHRRLRPQRRDGARRDPGAARRPGRKPGQDVIVVSIDGQRAALEAIGAGELGATVESNPRFGPLAFETIEKIPRRRAGADEDPRSPTGCSTRRTRRSSSPRRTDGRSSGSATDPRAAMAEPVLRMEGITKRFAGVTALDGVGLALERGEVHALVGENGAGKSTLIKIMTGAYRRDGGAIRLDGREVAFDTPADAQARRRHRRAPGGPPARRTAPSPRTSSSAREPRRWGSRRLDAHVRRRRARCSRGSASTSTRARRSARCAPRSSRWSPSRAACRWARRCWSSTSRRARSPTAR